MRRLMVIKEMVVKKVETVVVMMEVKDWKEEEKGVMGVVTAQAVQCRSG
jgi:hypothetical protein